MHKDTLTLLGTRLNKVKDVLGSLVVLVKQDLTFCVLPEECQVDDTKCLPLILYLFSRTIDDPRHLVHLDEI